jgi:putative hydrolase of the HAD superfamily
MLAGIRAVFFDAVGTLIHPDPPAPVVYARVGRRFGSRLGEAEVRARFRKAFAREEAADRKADWRTDEGRELLRWQAIVLAVLDDVSDPEACFRELHRHFGLPEAWRLEAGALAVLRDLSQRGYLLGLASNYDHRLRSVASGLPPLGDIPHLVISSEIGWRKPAGSFFAALGRVERTPPGQILYVGDDPANDYDGASAAGLRAVLFDPRHKGPSGVSRVTRLGQLVE